MALATYQFYTETYKGNAISEADFERLIVRAGSYIDSVKTVDVLPDETAAQMAQCAVAEEWQKNEQGGELQSESVGSWSRSFKTSNKSTSAKLFAAARLYIGSHISIVRWC